MRKLILYSVLLMVIQPSVYGQNPKTKGTSSQSNILKEVLTLHISRSGGANGASIAWHPAQKKYYAAMAGNVDFPMVVFNEKGKELSDDQLNTMFDVRGLWYNPGTKTLQTNGYDNFGWAEYKLNSKGIPAEARKLTIVTSQPDAQSVGAYDARKNVVYFFDYNSIGLERHKMKDGVSDTTIQLYLGAKTKDEASSIDLDVLKTNYNENAIICTGIPGAEVGLLNTTDRQIELYNLANGLMSQVLKLPDDAPAESSLNFTYANGIYWLFDKTARTWHGYKSL